MIRLTLLCWLVLQTTAAWALKPLATWIAKPDTLGLKYQQLTLATPDHVQLAAWLIEPVADVASQHTTMVLAGADYGNMSYHLYQARAMAAAGYHVLMFDYRGYGHSGAFTIDQKRLYYPEFATDLRTALLAARQRLPQQRVGILGYSMGTLIGSEVAATTPCDFLITDSYIANPQGLVAFYAAKQKVVTLPADAATYSQVAPKVKCSWLFIGGTEDQRTPLSDSLAVARAARRRQRREVLAVKCDHLGAMEVLTKKAYGDEYAQKVTDFLAGKPVSSKS